jgi:hypothetical protein
MMKKLFLLLTLFMPMFSLAHPGHGESSMFNHDLEHMLGYLLAITIFISFSIFKIKSNK